MLTPEQRYDRIAALYDIIDFPSEYFHHRKLRARIWRDVTGAVLDAGVGTGCNIPYYPDAAQVTGVDQSAGMLKRAHAKAANSRKDVTLTKACVYALPFPDAHFDYVIGTFVCCVLEDPARAAHEFRRVCKPGGEIRILEYVLSPDPIRRRIQRALSFYTRALFGLSFHHDSAQALQSAGFKALVNEAVKGDTIRLITARA